MADSPASKADAADFVERRESLSPSKLEAISARRSEQSPQRKRRNTTGEHRNKKRRRHSSSSSDDESVSEAKLESSSSPSSDQDSSSADSSSADSEQSDLEDERENAPSTSAKEEARESTDYVRFEIDDDTQKKWSLPEDMNKYLSKKFNNFIPDKTLKEKILDKYPLPSSSSIKAPDLDDYVPEIFSANNSSYGKSYDTNLHQIQGRIGTVMGPLSRIWLDLDNIRSGRESGENLDPTEWLKIVEKAITLLGQAFTTTTYHRRMNVLYNLTKDVKKAKKLLKSNSEDLASSQKVFGKKFYKALSKASKIKKKSKEISRHLGSSKFDKKKQRYDSGRFTGAQSSNRPFRSEAPSRGSRGGGRITFKTRRPPTKSQKR